LITFRHLYQNGQIVLTLYDAAEQRLPEAFSNSVTKIDPQSGEERPAAIDVGYPSGFANATDLKGPLAGQELTKLIDLINQGEAYVNFHTKDFPDGEIRGTISCCFEYPSGVPVTDDALTP